MPYSSDTFFVTLESVPMVIPQDLLALLACPVCKEPVLRPLPDNSGFKCEACKRVYPIRDEILVLMAEEARVVPD